MNVLIFGILAAFLELFGVVTGLGYRDASVLICIKVTPLVCMIPAVCMLANSIRKFSLEWKPIRIINYVLLSVSIASLIVGCFIYKGILERYKIASLEGGIDIFDVCRNDLLEMASALHISYIDCNIIVYVWIPILIYIFYLGLVYGFNKWYKKKVADDLLRSDSSDNVMLGN